jgi:GxxExxY protein
MFEFIKRDLHVKRQQGLPVIYETVKLDLGFKADFIIEDKIIFEVKSIETIAPVHQKQLLTYLRLTGIKLGILANFNCALIKDGLQRVVNNL